MTRASGGLAAVFFVLASCGVVGLLREDALPFPFWATYEQNQNHPVHPVTADSPVVIRFAFSERPPAGVVVPVEMDSGSASLEISVEEPESGRRLATATAVETGVVEMPLTDLAGARELLLRFGSAALNPDRAPRLFWSQTRSRQPHAVTVGGVDLGRVPGVPRTGPLFRLTYDQPTRWLLLAWPAAAGILAWGLRRPGREVWVLAAVALAASITSSLLWQKAYNGHASSYDPDQYGYSARTLAAAITDPETRADAGDWYREYPHSHTSLAPALMALPIALGAPWDFVYPEFSALCGFATLLLFFHALRAEMQVPRGIALALTVTLACHPELITAFAKPITDVFGLLLVMAMWVLLSRLVAGGSRRVVVTLALLAFALPLARPQGWSYWVFIALVLTVSTSLDARRFDWRSALTSGLAVFALPLLALAALYAHFGWLHNVELMLKKAQLFQGNTWQLFALSLATTLQLQPVLWAPLRAGLGSRALAIGVAWLAFYAAMLVAVRAPFFARHFLPLLPVVAALSAVSLARMGPRARWAGLALVGALCSWNVASAVRRLLAASGLPFFFWS